MKTLTVTLHNVCTEYVSKDDYNALLLVHEALQVSAQQELARVREWCGLRHMYTSPRKMTPCKCHS